jgi:hypothetical protein
VSDPFLSRWSRRKREVAAGQTPSEPASALKPPDSSSGQVNSTESKKQVAPTDAAPPTQTATPAEPLPSLADVSELTPSSNFQPFMREGVAPDVRNAAMKKLFADPHFNVMDGLDIYIDDYSQPDPLPAGMLQRMVGAQLLNLAAPEPPAQASASAPHVVTQENPAQSPHDPPEPAVVAQSPVAAAPLAPALPDHDNTDLQLQPHPAAAAPPAGSSPG